MSADDSVWSGCDGLVLGGGGGGGGVVEGEIEGEDVDAGFAEEAELAGLGMRFDEGAELGFGEAAQGGDAGDLVFSGGGGDVGIETGSGCGDEVYGDRGGGGVRLGGDAALDTIGEGLACGAEVRAGGGAGVVTGAGG